jgi:hypothetical protein
MYGYLRRFKSAAIRVRTEEPDFSTLPMQNFDWSETVYGTVQEEVPNDNRPIGYWYPSLLYSGVG